MPNAEKKVFFGLKNVHYALLTETTDPDTGVTTSSYGTVKAWPGAVGLTLDPNGNPIIFSADNSAYYTVANNRGYQGEYECARIPDDIRIDTCGNLIDDNGFIVETDKDQFSYFALMFEFDTDVNADRYVFYKVGLSQRPSVSSKTIDVQSDIEVGTEKVQFVAMPQIDDTVIDGITRHLIKAKTSKDVDATAYSRFYQNVYIPTFTGES